MTRKTARWLAAGLAAIFAAGCAQSNGDINKVQPNYTRKSDLLDGIWYFRNTVTGASANTGFTFTGQTGNLEKVVFEIQEDNLTAYRAYPLIVGTDRATIEENSKPTGTTTRVCKGTTCVGGLPYYGAPIAQYPIKSHFDIQRSYNAATGETSNVIVENSSDRPWNQREFIRVDWSASLINKGKSMDWGTVQNPAGGTDINAWIQSNEPGTDSYDWPVREYAQGADGEDHLTYMDFTGRYLATPETQIFRGYEDYGPLPLCWVNYRFDCTAQEIRMRTSIAKVDPNATNDYQPLVYGNDLMQKFGYFRTERLSYDPGFGTTESGRIYLANRYDTWKESFRKDASGAPDKAQVIPFAERTPKPIVYYVSPADRMGKPEIYVQYLAAARGYELVSGKWVKMTAGLEDGWDKAFRRATAAAMGKDVSEVPKMLYICENPVPANDTLTGEPLSADYIANCGQPGFEAKFGDLRHSFLYTITEPTPNGLLGYGPSSADPETGEIISANANTYTGAVDTSAQYAVDVIDLLSGQRTIDDHVKGDDVRRYFLNNPAYASLFKNASGSIATAQALVEDKGTQMHPAYKTPEARLTGLVARLGASGGIPELKSDTLASAAAKLAQRPDLESLLVDNPELSNDVLAYLPPPVAFAVSKDPSRQRDAARRVLLNMKDVHTYEQSRIDWASRNNVYLAEFMDRQMWTLAFKESSVREARVGELLGGGMSDLQARKVADQELRERLQQRIWRATSEHEIGHTFGLRHNFQASFDALNFFDTYWDMKAETLTVCAQASSPAVVGQQARCDFPDGDNDRTDGRKIIPGTPADLKAASDGTLEQMEQGLHDHEYSSIMDYGGKSNADFQGVGKYDEAAILFAYSGGSEPGYVEVFQTARNSDLTLKTSAGTDLTVPGAGYAMPIVTAMKKNTAVPNYTERFHYSLLPYHFGEGSPANLDDLMADGISRMRARSIMKWSDVKAGQDALREVLATNAEPAVAALDGMPIEVPFMFCTDDHVGSVLSCNRFDRGADYYEMNRTHLEDYWNSYFFTHFKRDRYRFDDNRAFNGAYGTFLDTGLIYKHWVYAMYQQTTTQSQNTGDYRSGKFAYDPLMFATWTMGVFDGFNHVLRVSQVPPAGYYARIVSDINLDGTVDQLDLNANGTDYQRAWSNISEGDEFDSLSEAGVEAVESLYDFDYKSTNVPNLTVPYGDAFAVMPRGEARRIYSRYDFKSGFGFQDRMVEVGHYNDQIGAMFAVIDPYADLIGIDRVADQRRYNIPYYLVFKNELTDTFGGMWAQDENKVRPLASLALDRNGTPVMPRRLELTWQDKAQASDFFQDFVYPAPARTLADFSPSAAAAPANITLTYTSRFYGLYLGMATFNINYDADFAKSVQLFKLGSGEQFEVAPGYVETRVEDITTGAVYVAVQPATATEDTAAVRMIKEALKYKRIYDNPSLVLDEQDRDNPAVVEETRKLYLEVFHGQIEDLDVMRGFYSVFGTVL